VLHFKIFRRVNTLTVWAKHWAKHEGAVRLTLTDTQHVKLPCVGMMHL
jgi:hypothetical protein